MNIFKSIKKLLTPEPEVLPVWKHLITLEQNFVYSNTDMVMYFHLLENDQGTRHVKFAASNLSLERASELGPRMQLYNHLIYPWLSGRYSDKIPRYQDIDSLDVAKRLGV